MISLNNHSVYSYTQSIAYPEDLAEQSKQLGNNTVFITDLDSLTASIKAASAIGRRKINSLDRKSVV